MCKSIFIWKKLYCISNNLLQYGSMKFAENILIYLSKPTYPRDIGV